MAARIFGLILTFLYFATAGAQAPEKKPLFVSVAGAPAMGDASANVAIVEFADFECPYCVAYANSMLPQVLNDYVRTGKVRYFFKDLPIEKLHSNAFKAAEAAHCAGEQDKYWEMHNSLFKSGGNLGPADLAIYARVDGLNVPEFQACLSAGRYESRIRSDVEESKQLGVPGTPAFFIGRFNAEGSKVTIEDTIVGTQPYTRFQQALDRLLARPRE